MRLMPVKKFKKTENKKVKRIGIDARFYGPKRKGLGRYTQKLVDYLEEIDGGSEERIYYVFLKKDNFDLFQPKHKNFKKVVADYHWYTFAEQLAFPFILYKHKLDLVHFCHFNVPILYFKKFIVTIHDLILFHYPTQKNTTLNKYFYFLKLFAYRLTIKYAAKRGKKLIAVSEYTKQDIKKNLKTEDSRLEMIYEGCDWKCFLAKGDSQNILEKYGIIKPHLLYVGNAYPHKNLERLLLAFSRLGSEFKNILLVLVGADDFFYNRLKKFVKEKEIQNVVFVGYVSDEDLDILYKEAELYIFPSLYEGFGLPPLEALAKGAPVISSNKTSMPEILGDSVEYFDPKDANGLTNLIEKKIGLNEQEKSKEKEEIKNKITELLEKFDWKKQAEQTLEIYKKV